MGDERKSESKKEGLGDIRIQCKFLPSDNQTALGVQCSQKTFVTFKAWKIGKGSQVPKVKDGSSEDKLKEVERYEEDMEKKGNDLRAENRGCCAFIEETIQKDQKNTDEVLLAQRGSKDKHEFCHTLVQHAGEATWRWRVISFLCMWIGFFLLFLPIMVFFKQVPVIGNIIEFICLLVSFLIAIVLWMLVFSFSWMFFRPALSITLIFFGIAMIVTYVQIGQSNQDHEAIAIGNGQF